MYNHGDLAKNTGLLVTIEYIYTNFNEVCKLMLFLGSKDSLYARKQMDTKLIQTGEKEAKYFSWIVATTQSLYSLVNNKFTINNSHILSAFSLENDIDFTVNDTYHVVNEFKKRGRKKCKSVSIMTANY